MGGLHEARLCARLSEQIGAAIASGFAEHVALGAADADEAELERRVNALIDAARGRASGSLGPLPTRMPADELGWVLDTLVENAPVMLFVKRAEDLVVELWNKQAERISGVPAADILGKTGFETFPADEMKAFHERDHAVLDGKRLVAIEEALTGPTGETRWIHTKKIPLLDELGEPRYLLGISEDVTERRIATEELCRAKEAAEAANQAKTDFLANVSHELRTPLTLMLGPADDSLADAGEPLPPRQRERLTLIRKNALRLLALVNALLDFSRLEAGRAQPSFAPHDLAALTADLAGSFRAAIERSGLRLVVDTEPMPADVYVDRDMWEKIVLNLLSNALKFTFEGSIRVSLSATPADVILEVRDTGTGIQPDELPHVFDRFHRVRGARSRTHEGTGIGLSLVREMVHLHRGTIRAESEVGRGTAMTVTIPRGTAHLPCEQVEAPGVPRSTAASAAPFVEEALRWLQRSSPAAPSAGPTAEAGARARILLAEDNADMRTYLVSLLGRTWDVTAMADGMAALAAARSAPWDLVISDVMMPEMDGPALLRALREDERTRSIPMILLSARAGEEATIEGLQAGADDYLIKPFSARRLVVRVESALTQARLRRELAEKQRASDAAEQANRMKDEFLATVSHELRTPLNAIVGWAAILRTSPPSSAALAKGLEVIGRNAAAQKAIIDDLLDVSRITTGHLRLEPEVVDLDAVVSDTIDVVMPSASAKGIEVRRLHGPDPCRVVGDPQRLRQVVWNLLSNAIKFTPPGGRVEVTLGRAASAVTLVVHDTGEGIAPSLLPYVFDWFRQADGSTTRRHGGLGLGLSIVRQLVELHGGEVRAESPGVGKGATFSITLPTRALAPAAEAAGPAAAGQRAEAPAGKLLERVRVLVVDDEEDARDLLEACLTSWGAVVAKAGTAREAVRSLAQFRPDIVVSDIGMPHEDGITMIRQIRGAPLAWHDVPAIALSAYASPADASRALAAGFQRYLPKPIDPTTLVRTVLEVRNA